MDSQVTHLKNRRWTNHGGGPVLSGLYFDTAYVAKCYLNEPEAAEVRKLARSARGISISALTIAEIACLLHRSLREGTLTAANERTIREQFLEDLANESWILIPITEHILRQVETITRKLHRQTLIRAGDAIHLVTALDSGFQEIWTNDRHLLAAAPHFGITGRHVVSGTER